MKKIFLILFLLSCRYLSSPCFAVCDESAIIQKNAAVFSDVLNADIQLTIYLPACYDARVILGYPVLYLLHGQDMTQSVWKEMGLPDLIRKGQADQTYPRFIVVTPKEDNNLTPIVLSNFGEAIIQTVIPYIDKTYNTCTERTCRAIGGISRGALWAEGLAFNYPELFESVGMHSIPGSYFETSALSSIALSHPKKERLRVWMDVGNEDPYRLAGREVSDQLNDIGYDHVRILNDGGHNVDYWRKNLPAYLEWYSKNWPG